MQAQPGKNQTALMATERMRNPREKSVAFQTPFESAVAVDTLAAADKSAVVDKQAFVVESLAVVAPPQRVEQRPEDRDMGSFR
jgi:hypothetical protein